MNQYMFVVILWIFFSCQHEKNKVGSKSKSKNKNIFIEENIPEAKAWDPFFKDKKNSYNFFYESPFGGCLIIK